jgi:transglutaminase-like putative cysteine protease
MRHRSRPASSGRDRRIGPTRDDDEVEPQPSSTFHVEMRFGVTEPGRLLFALAPASSAGTLLEERFAVDGPDGERPSTVVVAPHGSRLHLVEATEGILAVQYDATLVPSTATPSAVDPFETLLYGRPSRYCPSDHLGGFAVAEFGTSGPAIVRAEAIVTWIAERVKYVAGSSSVHDSAEDTLLTGVGTCRDFAHLGVALCRAVDIPARFTSTYAPGLKPMDFHAVFEIFDDGQWWVLDATRSAPRGAMSRIATGRDASDTAFATVLDGIATLEDLLVLATTQAELIADTPGGRVVLP